MTQYTKKLHEALVNIGKKVEQRQNKETPSWDDLMKLYIDFEQAVADDDMKAQSHASGELIVALVKWRVEEM